MNYQFCKIFIYNFRPREFLGSLINSSTADSIQSPPSCVVNGEKIQIFHASRPPIDDCALTIRAVFRFASLCSFLIRFRLLQRRLVLPLHRSRSVNEFVFLLLRFDILGFEMMIFNQKKNQNAKGHRILITINVIRSAGPIRLVVHEEETVANVIDMSLKAYAREGRIPLLGSDISKFMLHCPIAESDALRPEEAVGRYGMRNFMLSKKPETLITNGNDRLLFQKLRIGGVEVPRNGSISL